MDDSARFRCAVSAARPHGQRLIEAYSPKLGRRLQCFGDAVFRQWIRLEADPSVQQFCERPAFLQLAHERRLADFWVRQGESELFVILGDPCLRSTVELGDDNEYEWLRDVHDHLDRLQIRLLTFLVGQQDLYAIKINLQHAGKTQIVARLMVDELAFVGIRNARDVATCLAGYGQTSFPRGTEWTFTRFYLPQAAEAGYRRACSMP